MKVPFHRDVLGLGCLSVDDLAYVDAYPPPDAKIRVSRTERHCGGLTGTALVAASRLGARCGYAGVVGTDPLSDYALNRLSQEGIEVSHVRKRAEARVVHSFIIVGLVKGTRNVFADVNGSVGADPDWPDPEIVRASRVLFVDHFGLPGMIRAAAIARDAGRPVVADIENTQDPKFLDLFNLVNHPILSEPFAKKFTGEPNAVAAVRSLCSKEREAIVVTGGTQGCWYVGSETGGRIIHQAAFDVDVVDTTGCGDVFHGAYAAALARGAGLVERILIASASAALKAAKPGGQEGIPDRETVDQFLKTRTRNTARVV